MDAHGALTGLHVLVVEDNADARAILTAVLEYCGAFVTQIETAADALRFLQQATPDAVVADMHLPDHDAPWLVREAQHLRTVAPFIAVSAADFDRKNWKRRDSPSSFGSPSTSHGSPTPCSPWSGAASAARSAAQ